MIQQLTALRGIGVQSATVLVREAFVRRFANGKALRIIRWFGLLTI
jgi:transposase